MHQPGVQSHSPEPPLCNRHNDVIITSIVALYTYPGPVTEPVNKATSIVTLLMPGQPTGSSKILYAISMATSNIKACTLQGDLTVDHADLQSYRLSCSEQRPDH